MACAQSTCEARAHAIGVSTWHEAPGARAWSCVGCHEGGVRRSRLVASAWCMGMAAMLHGPGRACDAMKMVRKTRRPSHGGTPARPEDAPFLMSRGGRQCGGPQHSVGCSPSAISRARTTTRFDSSTKKISCAEIAQRMGGGGQRHGTRETRQGVMQW